MPLPNKQKAGRAWQLKLAQLSNGLGTDRLVEFRRVRTVQSLIRIQGTTWLTHTMEASQWQEL
jgi:hypothetical protein